MNGIRIAPDKFLSMLNEKGLNRHALARQIGSTSYQMWRLTSPKHTTSFRFLAKLVPVFGLVAVSDIIADQDQSDAFTFWYTAHYPNRPKRASKTSA